MLKSVTPILWVKSIEDAVDYYEQKLGFTLDMAMRGPDGKMAHAMVSRDGVGLMIGYKMNDKGELDLTGLGGGAELYFATDAVDDYYGYVRGAGASITMDIEDKFWGDRTFTVTDPDGYVLTFAQTVRAFDPSQPMPTTA
jgi:PhnB protein